MQPPSFSMRVLARLRAEGYQPRAWGRLLADSWAQARATAGAQRDLVRGWRATVGGLGVLTGVALFSTERRYGYGAMWRNAVPLIVANALQAGDIYVHLGLHRGETGQHYATLGVANDLTALRCWVAAWMSSRLVAGMPLADDELVLAIALICLTDIADGRVARHLGQTSPLGRYLDGEADLLAWLALTVTQIRRGQVPAWFLGIFGLRWGVPVVVGLARTFAEAQPVALQPSPIARAAGIAQVAMSLAGIIAARQASQPSVVISAMSKALVGFTTSLLGMAMVGQLLRLLRPARPHLNPTSPAARS